MGFNNLKKQAQLIQERQLREQPDFMTDGLEIGDKQLDGVRDNKDLIDTTEVQMDGKRGTVAEALTESQLNNSTSKLVVHRDDTNEKLSVQPLGRLNQAQEAEYTEAYKEAEIKKRDTEFWDKYVGEEMLGRPTKMINRMGPSQLGNNPDRFTNLSTELPPLADNKNNEVSELVTASLMDADAVLFHVYAQAASEGRKINAAEENLIEAINEEKMNILAALGDAPPFGEAMPQMQEHHDPNYLAHRIEKLQMLMDREMKANGHTDTFERMHEECQELIEQSRHLVQDDGAVDQMTPMPEKSMAQQDNYPDRDYDLGEVRPFPR